jgi:uncharacterized membrane protein (DUF441 family)
MSNYRKLIAAIVGLLVILLYRQFGIDLTGTEEFLVEILVSTVTAVAVYAFPNTPLAGNGDAA